MICNHFVTVHFCEKLLVIIFLLCISVNRDLHHLVTVYYIEPWHVSSSCCVLLQTTTAYYCAVFQTVTFSI